MKYHYVVDTENFDTCTGSGVHHISNRPLSATEVLDALGPDHFANHAVSKGGLKCSVKLERIESDIPTNVHDYVESVAHLHPRDNLLAVSAVAHMMDSDYDKANGVIHDVLDGPISGLAPTNLDKYVLLSLLPHSSAPLKVETARFLQNVRVRAVWASRDIRRNIITTAVTIMEELTHLEAGHKINQFYVQDNSDNPQD